MTDQTVSRNVRWAELIDLTVSRKVEEGRVD